MKRQFSSFIILQIVFVLCVDAQVRRQKNYREFDEKLFHFGFTLGANTANFNVDYSPDFEEEPNLLRIDNRQQIGFNLGIVSSMNIIPKTLKLRLVPSLSFQERLFQYTYRLENGNTEVLDKRVESTNLDFPLLLKYRTFRYNNFAAYFLGGGQYSLDLASQIDVDNGGPDPIIIINKHDWAWQVGTGVDFFLPYFKFGIEIKLSQGIRDVLIQDNTRFANHLSELKTRVWWISLTFEG